MTEHPFAQYVRILGKGKNGKRPLTRQEAHDAMRMIYQFDVEPEQLGAFLMLMRVKEESAEEVAGFVQAIRESIPLPLEALPQVDIDWPSYAGKRRQLPWYVLAALLLSHQGYAIFMHGLSRDDERVYTRQALEALGVPIARTLPQAVNHIIQDKFTYLDIKSFSSLTAELLDTRDLLGLRSPLHTVVRMLNPFDAQLTLHSVFHPNYAEIHQQAAQLLGETRALSFKGEGGECERVPDRGCMVYGVNNEHSWQAEWEPLLSPGKYGRESFPDLEHFVAVWRGEREDRYAEAAVTGTMALCLQSLNDSTQQQALEQARSIWHSRQVVALAERCA